MNMESQVREKEVSVELDGYTTRLMMCNRILAECERIKAAAKVLLEEIKVSGNDEKAADARVKAFLKDSIRGLLGEEAAAEIFDKEPPEITNMTAVLCRQISQIGTELGSADDEEEIG